MVHLGIILILAGGFLGSLFGVEGFIEIKEGQSADGFWIEGQLLAAREAKNKLIVASYQAPLLQPLLRLGPQGLPVLSNSWGVTPRVIVVGYPPRIAAIVASKHESVIKITCGNYGGKLGPYKIYLKDAIKEALENYRDLLNRLTTLT